MANEKNTVVLKLQVHCKRISKEAMENEKGKCPSHIFAFRGCINAACVCRHCIAFAYDPVQDDPHGVRSNNFAKVQKVANSNTS